GERLRAGEVTLRDLVVDDSEEETETDEDGERTEQTDDLRQRRRFLAQIARIKRLDTERTALQRRSARLRGATSARVARIGQRVLAALCGLGLSHRQIGYLSGALQRAAERMEQLRATLRANEERTGRSTTDMLRLTAPVVTGAALTRTQRRAIDRVCLEI